MSVVFLYFSIAVLAGVIRLWTILDESTLLHFYTPHMQTRKQQPCPVEGELLFLHWCRRGQSTVGFFGSNFLV